MSSKILYLFEKTTKNHLILISFSIFSIRAGIFGASIGDSIFFLGALSLLGYKEYLESLKKVDLNEKTLSEVTELKNIISGLNMKGVIKSPEAQQPFKRYF
jgi:hypothetical protein